MRFLFLKTGVFVVALLCVASAFAQNSEWIAGDKLDDIEVFYQVEKSGSNIYEVEVKIINKRAKPVDLIIKFEQKAPIAGALSGGVWLLDDKSKYLKLSVKAKETFVGEKVELEGLPLKAVKIVCWSNTTAQKKCDLETFVPTKPKVGDDGF